MIIHGELARVMAEFDKVIHYNMFNMQDAPYILDAERALHNFFVAANLIPKDEWYAVGKTVTLTLTYKLGAFSIRMATMAARTHDESYLFSGTMAILLDDNLLDIPDVLVITCVLFDAGTRIGANPELIFRRAAEFAVPSRSRLILEDFLNGPDYMKSIESMGFRFVESPNGSFYIGNQF